MLLFNNSCVILLNTFLSQLIVAMACKTWPRYVRIFFQDTFSFSFFLVAKPNVFILFLQKALAKLFACDCKLSRTKEDEKQKEKTNVRRHNDWGNNLSCDLRAEAYRETREVAPPQGSHSPGNNREKKAWPTGLHEMYGWDQEYNLHGVNYYNILYLRNDTFIFFFFLFFFFSLDNRIIIIFGWEFNEI